MAAEDHAGRHELLKEAGIAKPGDRVRIFNALGLVRTRAVNFQIRDES